MVRQVYLTLDDGPDRVLTPAALDILDAANVKATFFMVGRNAETYIDIVESVHAAGHRIGNHSLSHADLSRVSVCDVYAEIAEADSILRPYMGETKLFRPPYGACTPMVGDLCTHLGYDVTLWDVDTRDWNRCYQPDGWVDHGIAQLQDRDAAIVLCHDTHRTTIENLEAFITRVTELGPVEFRI